MSAVDTASDDERDAGLTLVELIVTASLLGLVMTVVGGILISLFTTERTVTGVTQGTTAAQLTATSIGDRVRNSSEFRVFDADAGADQLLVARVASSGGALDWRCHAWYYDSAGVGEIRTTSTPDGVSIDVPADEELEEWTILVEGVAPPAGLPVFTEAGARLEVRFDADAGDSPTVAIRFTAVRLTGVTEGETCF